MSKELNEVMLHWGTDKPREPGLYLFQLEAGGPIHKVVLSFGNWQKAQNPDWMYCDPAIGDAFLANEGGEVAHRLKGFWLGPIRGPKRVLPDP